MNLVMIPFRESPVQGMLFLIPPLTFFCLAQHWKKMRRAVQRIVVPILTIGLVVMGFVAESWLKGEGRAQGSIENPFEAGVPSLETGMEGELGKVPNRNGDGSNTREQKGGGVMESP